MKKFSINCDFGGVSAPFVIYIGNPEPSHHPLHFQGEWLSKNRGGTIPSDIMESINKLFELSKKNNVSFEDLCVYALNSNPVGEHSEFEDSDLGAPPPPS